MNRPQRQKDNKEKGFARRLGGRVESLAARVAKIPMENRTKTLYSLVREDLHLGPKKIMADVKEIFARDPNFYLLQADDIIDVIESHARLLASPEEKKLVLRTLGGSDILHSIPNLEEIAKKLGAFTSGEKVLVGASVIKTLGKLCSLYKNHSFGYEVRISLPGVSKNFEMSIDNRIHILVLDQWLIISGQVFGSEARAAVNLKNELALLFHLLRFENIIYEKDDAVFGVTNVSFKIPQRVQSNLTLSAVQEYYKNISGKYASNRILPNIEAFKLLGNMKSEKIDTLRFVLNFFNTDRDELTSMIFLKHWIALEILGGSPGESIEKTLYYNLAQECPGLIDANEFKVLWALRGKIVHTGEIEIDEASVWQMKSMAQNVFRNILQNELKRDAKNRETDKAFNKK